MNYLTTLPAGGVDWSSPACTRVLRGTATREGTATHVVRLLATYKDSGLVKTMTKPLRPHTQHLASFCTCAAEDLCINILALLSERQKFATRMIQLAQGKDAVDAMQMQRAIFNAPLQPATSGS